MPARRLVLHALLGPALAGLPATLAWAPGFPPVELRAGAPVTLDASVPGGRGSTRNVALASGEGHTIALVGAADLRRTNLVEVGIGKPARLITSFPLGARNPTVGTDRTGKVVVLVRACGGRTRGNKPADCRIQVVNLRTGFTAPLIGSAGGDIAAMDRGAVVGATGASIGLTGAPAADGRKGQTVGLPPLEPGRSGTTIAGVTDLDLSDGNVSAVFDLSADFGGSQLARYDAARGWTTLGVSTDGGAAIGHRAFYAPTFTRGGVRAFYDGAEDLPGYAGRWTTGSKPVREVRAAKLGNPVLLTSAAFLGDRLVVFGYEDRCELDDCQLTTAGPFPVG